MTPMLPKRPDKDADIISASWLNRLMDCIDFAMKYPQGDNRTIVRNNNTLSLLSAKTGQGSSPSSAYNGPFKVAVEATEDGSLTAKLLGYNPAQGRYWRNYVFLGATTLELQETSIGSLIAESYIYLEITYADNAYVLTPKTQYMSLPPQTQDAYIVPLAFYSSKGLVQLQLGMLTGTGRIF